jgi:CheY-like chemotaxis protein
MAQGRILVVAPNEALRLSLAFALEAEGYEVTARGELPYHGWVAQKAFDATVLDQRALTGANYESIAFCVKAHPVVLLASRPHPWLVEWVSDVVEMPVVGNAVASALDRTIVHGQ